jgi:hypothetical protein
VCAPAFLPNLPTRSPCSFSFSFSRPSPSSQRGLTSLSHFESHSCSAWAVRDAKEPGRATAARTRDLNSLACAARFLDTGLSVPLVHCAAPFRLLSTFTSRLPGKLWNGDTVLCSATHRFAFHSVLLVRLAEPRLSLSLTITSTSRTLHTAHYHTREWVLSRPRHAGLSDHTTQHTPVLSRACHRTALYSKAQAGSRVTFGARAKTATKALYSWGLAL